MDTNMFPKKKNLKANTVSPSILKESTINLELLKHKSKPKEYLPTKLKKLLKNFLKSWIRVKKQLNKRREKKKQLFHLIRILYIKDVLI